MPSNRGTPSPGLGWRWYHLVLFLVLGGGKGCPPIMCCNITHNAIGRGYPLVKDQAGGTPVLSGDPLDKNKSSPISIGWGYPQDRYIFRQDQGIFATRYASCGHTGELSCEYCFEQEHKGTELMKIEIRNLLSVEIGMPVKNSCFLSLKKNSHIWAVQVKLQ